MADEADLEKKRATRTASSVGAVLYHVSDKAKTDDEDGQAPSTKHQARLTASTRAIVRVWASECLQTLITDPDRDL